MAYRPETPYFVRFDEPPTASQSISQHRERHWDEGASTNPGPQPRRRRKKFRIRPVGVVFVALLGWVGWAYTTPGGPEARISSWIDQTRGEVNNVSVGPGLSQTATYFDGLYKAEGSYPDMSETAIQEDPNAGFGLGMSFIFCTDNAVVLQAPSASGSVSRLLLLGKDLGDVEVAAGCPTNLAHPSPWKLSKKSGE